MPVQERAPRPRLLVPQSGEGDERGDTRERPDRRLAAGVVFGVGYDHAGTAAMVRNRTVFADKGRDAEHHRDLCRRFGAKP